MNFKENIFEGALWLIPFCLLLAPILLPLLMPVYFIFIIVSVALLGGLVRSKQEIFSSGLTHELTNIYVKLMKQEEELALLRKISTEQTDSIEFLKLNIKEARK